MFAIFCVFSLPLAIVWTVVRGPKARAQAEIMKAESLARLEDKRGLISAVKTEELSMVVSEQQARIETLEEELGFMKKLLEDKSR